MPASAEYVVHGVRPSFFTRKVTGYLDYKRLPWWLSPDAGSIPAAREAGWPGGIPVVATPEGEMIWDSTAMIIHLDRVHPEPGVTPPGTFGFLDFLVDDFVDEWLYRPAIGTRWLWPENTVTGRWEIAREASYSTAVPAAIAAKLDGPPPPPSGDAIQAFVEAAMNGAMVTAGVNAENIDAWMGSSVGPFQRALAAHLTETSPYLFGERPSLGDFALFGANMAHFTNDPACRRWIEGVAPRVIEHTHALATSRGRSFGDWRGPDEVPETLVAVLAELGRHYLPWAAEATVSGDAQVDFGDGVRTTIAPTDFLRSSRATLLARYAEARTDELDAVLERAGILAFFADHPDQAGTIPDPAVPPQQGDNWPYPAIPQA